MKALFLSGVLTAAAATACSQPNAGDAASTEKNILEGSGWSLAQSPYLLRPGQTIAVCDTGVKAGVRDLVIDAVRTWMDEGGRDERISVKAGCSGDRIVKLVPAPASVSWYGQTSPLSGNVHKIEVPPQWASFWTANHEVGHVFGFAHNFSEVSIMNSKNNGAYMNGGRLSIDRTEIKRMLAQSAFTSVNAAWADGGE